MAEGRVLAIDYGRSYIGLAISDQSRLLATPLDVWRFPRSQEALVDRLAVLSDKEQVTAICIGYPQNPSPDRPAPLLRDVEELGKLLKRRLGLPIHFVSEEFSSLEADELRRTSGRRKRQRNDAAAAAVILQRFLDEGRNGDS